MPQCGASRRHQKSLAAGRITNCGEEGESCRLALQQPGRIRCEI